MNSRKFHRGQGRAPHESTLPIATAFFLAVGVVFELEPMRRKAYAAEITAAAQVLGQSINGMLNEIDSQTDPDPGGPVSTNKQAGLGVLGGVAHATSGLGWFRLNAFADSVVSPVHDAGYLDAIATGEFVDEIIVTPGNPALLNQPGAATFSYHVDGFVSRGEGGSAVQSAVTSPYQGLGTLLANDFYGEAFGTYLDVTHEYIQNFVFGQSFELRVFMFARARVEVNGAFDIATFAEVDLGNTFERMGAAKVVDQSDVEVSDYDMTSTSGTDYRNAIMAPADSAPIPGDYNQDGAVDAADYTVWRDHLGTSFALGGNGDETDDSAGVVDQADYALWKANFGNLAGSGAFSNAAVPEPSTFVLLAAAIVGIALRRWN
jgi:PEP-CTERM motif